MHINARIIFTRNVTESLDKYDNVIRHPTDYKSSQNETNHTQSLACSSSLSTFHLPLLRTLLILEPNESVPNAGLVSGIFAGFGVIIISIVVVVVVIIIIIALLLYRIC